MLISVEIEESQESRTLGVVVKSCESGEWLREVEGGTYLCLGESGERRNRVYVFPTDRLMQASAGIGECQTQFSVLY